MIIKGKNLSVSLAFMLCATVAAMAQDFQVRTYPLPEYTTAADICIDSAAVWVATATGAARLRNGAYDFFNASTGLGIDSVFLIEKAQKTIWFAGQTGIALRKDDGSWKYYNKGIWNYTEVLDATGDVMWLSYKNSEKRSGLMKITATDTTIYQNEFDHVTQSKDGTYWASGAGGLYFMNSGGVWQIDTSYTRYNQPFMFDTYNNLWLVAEGKLRRRRAGHGAYEVIAVPFLEDWSINTMASDKRGVLYFGTWANGLAIKAGDTWYHLDKSNGLLSNNIQDIEIDAEGNVWISHNEWTRPGLTSGLSVILSGVLPEGDAMAKGTIFSDKNNDGIQDADEVGIPNQFIKLMPSGSYAITDDNGEFSFMPAFGTNTITAQLSGFWEQGESPLSYTFTYNGGPVTQSFPIGFKWRAQRDLSAYVSGSVMRPGFQTYYYVYANNQGSVTENPVVAFNYDPALTVVSTEVTPSASSPGHLEWNITDFGMYHDKSIRVDLQVPTTAQLGSVYKAIASIKPEDNDINPDNNSDTLATTVTGSYDPNDKLVDEGTGEARYALMNTRLNYRIRFQNTGTDTAFVVRIKDQLDANLDITSLQIVAASHPMTYRLDDRLLTFTFKNIELPDSTRDEPNSHGYVRYSISPRTGLAENTVIRNKADIYFDFNEPVATNEVFNTYVTRLPEVVTGVDEWQADGVAVYPNPSTDGAIQIVLNDAASVQSGELIASSGRRVFQFTTTGENDRILLNDIPPGLYLLRLQRGSRVTVTKVMVTR